MKALERTDVWSVVRKVLPALRESMRRATLADSYGKESRIFDAIARDIADAVVREIGEAR